MTAREDLHLLTGAYALGALDPHETAEFEAYLTQSEEARTEVAELTDTAVVLGLATRPIEPPAALKSRIMAQILNTPQLTSVTSAGAADAGAATLAPAPLAPVTSIGSTSQRMTPEAEQGSVSAQHPAAQSDATPTADESRRIRHLASGSAKSNARWFGRPAAILVTAAAAVGLFFAGSAVGPMLGSQPQDSQAASFTELYAAPDLEQQVSSVTGGGEATLLWSDGLQRAAVVISDLPALSADQTYELWFIDSGSTVSAGIFDAADAGSTLRVLDGQLTDSASIAITIEPAGGSEAPTTDPIAVIESA